MAYCRLCAEPKSDDDLCASINDSKLNILEKLMVCCQWDTYPLNPELPDYICFLCSEKLEKSWLFSVCVSEAQRKLLRLFNDAELLPIRTEEAGDDGASLLDENLENIFVEAIPMPDLRPDSIDEMIPEPESIDDLIGSTIESTNGKIVCDICKKVFTTIYNLTVHNRTHTNERPYVCSNENCDKQFRSSSNLNQHLRKVHGKPPYTPKPREIFAAEVIEKLVEKPTIDIVVENPPEKEHFNETCDICGRKFRLKCTLKAHRTIHFSERKFECTLCHRAFKRMKLLRVHMRIHTQFPSIPCPVCRKLFRRTCQRDRHIRERHGVPAPKREKKLPAPPKKPMKKFTCELCGLSFTQKGGLSTHMTVHSDNRPFKCDICNLGFKRKRTMQDHRKTHTHSHEFKCNFPGCGKSFRKKISLSRHIEYHSGNIVRPFQCNCGKSFRLKSNFVEHQRIHTGEKPYFCEFKSCSQTFRTMSSFYSHLKKEHGVSVMARKLEQQARATALTP